MALPSREDGAADDRHPPRHRRQRRRGVPASDAQPAAVSGPLGDPDGVLDAAMDPASLYASPNALAPHYSRFGVSERLLLTGHSHQAWPDCGFDGQHAGLARRGACTWTTSGSTRSAQAERVRQGFAALLGDARRQHRARRRTPTSSSSGCSPRCRLRSRPRLVTTDGEFHSIRRQLDRLAEEGLDIVRVPEAPLESLAARLARAVDDRTALVLVSAVFFDTGRIAPDLPRWRRAAAATAAGCSWTPITRSTWCRCP